VSKKIFQVSRKVREETADFQADLNDDIVELDDTFFERAALTLGR
jgi:hypothetical protein